MRSVLQQHRGGEADAVGDRAAGLAGRQGLAAQDAVLVGKGEPYDGEPVGEDAALDLARRLPSILVPEAGLLSEVHGRQATSGERVSDAQLDSLRRRASNSFQ